jgi:hypothetical protein
VEVLSSRERGSFGVPIRVGAEIMAAESPVVAGAQRKRALAGSTIHGTRAKRTGHGRSR